jgi:hypothetical protein
MDTPEPAPRADDDRNAATRRAGHESTLHRAETLLTSINEVAASTRNLFVTLLLFMLYIAITAASTTDEQLLRDSAIAVPLLPAANVPASSFYGIAPLLLLILHLELLLNLDRLCIRMRMFREVKARLRKYELPFLISQLSSFQMVQWSLGSNERIIRALTGTIMFLSTAFAPLLILLDLQYAFLAFHSTPITTLQRSVVAFDALLILAFWPRLMKARHDPRTSGPPRRAPFAHLAETMVAIASPCRLREPAGTALARRCIRAFPVKSCRQTRSLCEPREYTRP